MRIVKRFGEYTLRCDYCDEDVASGLGDIEKVIKPYRCYDHTDSDKIICEDCHNEH